MSQTKFFAGSISLQGTLLALILLSGVTGGTAFALDYTMIDLGTLGGVSAWARGINGSGQVVGVSIGSDGQEYPFLWSADSGMQTLPTNPHFVPLDISGNGVVAGYVDSYAAFWSSTLGLNTLGEAGGAARSANDKGYVAGWAGRNSDPYREKAYVWSLDGTANDLGLALETSASWAFGINDHGQVVGTAANGAFVWDADNGVQYLGALGGDRSSGDAINDAGMVVGVSDVDWHTRAVFTWTTDSGMSSVFTFGYDDDYGPVAVNSSGTIVGNSSKGVFMWTASDGLTIVSPGQVFGINDAGQLVGQINTTTGLRAVIWQPVPEPSSLSFLTLALAGVGIGVVRRRR